MSFINRRRANLPAYRRWSRYLIAHSCKSLIWHSSGLLFAFFLTEICGLRPKEMGAVIASSLFINALADLAFSGRWNRCCRSPKVLVKLQVIGALFTGLFFVAFAALPLLPPLARLPMAITTLIAFRTSFAMFDVPQNTMVTLLSPEFTERTSLLAARNICSGLAGLLVVLVATPILLSGTERALRYLWWAVALGFAAALSAYALARSIHRRYIEPTAGIERCADERAPACLLLLLTGVLVAANTLFRSLEPYAAAYAGFGMGILVWASIGAIVCQPFWVMAGRRLSRSVAAALAGVLALTGVAGLAGPLGSHPAGILLAGLGFGVGTGGLWLMLWMIAMRHDALRRTARLTAVSKAAQGIAALCLGHVLQGTPYRLTMVDASSSPRLMMVGALSVVAACGFALAIIERRISRTASDAGSARPHPAAPRVPDPVGLPQAASPTPGCRAVPAA